MKTSHPTSLKEATVKIIEERYALSKVQYDIEITPELNWSPTCLWKKNDTYYACEILDDKPNVPILEIAYSQIISLGLPVKMIASYMQSSQVDGAQLKDNQKNEKYLINKGLGLIRIDENFNAEIIAHGISVLAFISINEVNNFNYHKLLKKIITDAHEVYLKHDPKSGIIELGQTIEVILFNLAIQAIAKNKINTNYKPGKTYSQAQIIEDLMISNVIDKAILGRCRGYCDDRNRVSHKPKNDKEAKIIENQVKPSFITGLRILSELPVAITKKGYKFKVGPGR
jgi:hypothetical protein